MATKMVIKSRNSNRHFLIIFVMIVFAASFVRLFKLGTLPVILNRDEAALAYNAFLLDKTGRDEWGRERPLFLESFGDFKLPGYPLVVEALFKFLPENDFVVRLPSAAAGIGLVLLMAAILNRLGFERSQILIGSLFVALVPFSVFYSRMAFEANLALSMMIVVFLGNFRSLENYKKPDFIFDLSTIFVTLFMVFTYNTPLLLLPFFTLLMIFYRGIKKWQNWLFLALGQAAVFVFTALKLLPLSAQKSGITIFSDETIWMSWIMYRENFSGVWQNLLGHKYLYFLQIIIKNFFASFSPNFSVMRGGSHPWHTLPGFGHLYWSIYILAAIGIFLIIKKIISNLRSLAKVKNEVVLMFLLVFSLIPSVITVDSPHATRSLLFFFLLIVMSIFAAKQLMKFKVGKTLLTVVLLVFVFESANYFRSYFIEYPKNQSMYLPGFEKAVTETVKNDPNMQIAVVDPNGFQYILTAWYLKTNPESYFSTIIMQQPDSIGFRYGQQMENFHFIANAKDRSAQEKVEIIWQNNSWVVNNY